MDDQLPPIEVSQQSVLDLIYQFSGQRNILTIPRAYLDWLDGDHVAALMLSQILYWSERTSDPEGWFYKSSKDWNKELAVSTYQQNRAVKKLAPIGVETTLKKAKGAPTVHYRINRSVFSKWIFEKLRKRPDPIYEKLANAFSEPSEDDSEETSESLPTEITSETMQKTGESLEKTFGGVPVDALWEAALDIMVDDSTVSQANIVAWLKPARIAGVRPNGVVVIRAPHSGAARRISAYYVGEIQQAIEVVVGRQVQVEVIA